MAEDALTRWAGTYFVEVFHVQRIGLMQAQLSLHPMPAGTGAR